MSVSDFTLIGHVCVDEVEGGGSRLGGTVHFAAGQARALGCDVRVITAATESLARSLFDAHDGALDLDLLESPADTAFGFNEHADGGPSKLLSSATVLDPGAVALLLAGRERGTVHLGPIANEFAPGLIEMARAGADYLGITPQGILRRFAPDGTFDFDASGWTSAVHLADALVVNETEYDALVDLGLLDGFEGLVFRTLGSSGATVSRAGVVLAERQASRTEPVADPAHTIGAGDVFAAAAFLAHAAGESADDALEVAVELAGAYVHRGTDEPAFYGIEV